MICTILGLTPEQFEVTQRIIARNIKHDELLFADCRTFDERSAMKWEHDLGCAITPAVEYVEGLKNRIKLKARGQTVRSLLLELGK